MVYYDSINNFKINDIIKKSLYNVVLSISVILIINNVQIKYVFMTLCGFFQKKVYIF